MTMSTYAFANQFIFVQQNVNKLINNTLNNVKKSEENKYKLLSLSKITILHKDNSN